MELNNRTKPSAETSSLRRGVIWRICKGDEHNNTTTSRMNGGKNALFCRMAAGQKAKRFFLASYKRSYRRIVAFAPVVAAATE